MANINSLSGTGNVINKDVESVEYFRRSANIKLAWIKRLSYQEWKGRLAPDFAEGWGGWEGRILYISIQD